MIQFKCKICGNITASKFLDAYDKKKYTYVKCKKCKTVMHHPYPTLDEIKNIYSDNYFNYEISNQENFYNLMKLGLKDINFNKLYDKPGKILDIGCAMGRLLFDFKQKGWETQGIEICHESAKYGRNNYNLDIKNPHVGEQVNHDPDKLLKKYAKQQQKISGLRGQLKTILAEALNNGGAA